MNERQDSNVITREYLDSLLVETRYVGADIASTEVSYFGKTFATPIMCSTFSHYHKLRDHAVTELANGIKNAGALNWTGLGSDEELEEITATGVSCVKVIKPLADEDEIFRQIEHANACGAIATGMDIDHSFGEGGYDICIGEHMRPKTMEQLRSYAKASKVPFIVKGVLSVHDTDRCLEAGVSGILVSHHHGRMQSAVPPLFVLPEIVKLVNGRIPIFADCGFESGLDAFKALALGADGIGVSRSLLEDLKNGGAEAVEKRIRKMTAELAYCMACTGARTVKDIDPAVIHHRSF